jgi:Damage-control phosphatase ARMT1-like domain
VVPVPGTLTVVPPELLNNDPAGYAWGVWHDRTPKLISQLKDAHPFSAAQRRALDDLLAETASWADASFLWSESVFFQRLLEAIGFFTPGPWYYVDPFAYLKAAELHDDAAESALTAVAGQHGRDKLLASAWGNRADLGFRIDRTADPEQAGLVADDSTELWAVLDTATDIVLVADNAGRELMADLILIDQLLTSEPVRSVSLQVKPHPYYVSDATTADAVACLDRLTRTQATAAAAGRLTAAVAAGRFTLDTHEFYCAPWSYHRMPDDLAGRFRRASLTIMKGDLNYRRLAGDLAWPPSTPFAEAVSYFPGPVAALRTLKSDVITGIDPAMITRLGGPVGSWRTDGSHGLIQVYVPAT